MHTKNTMNRRDFLITAAVAAAGAKLALKSKPAYAQDKGERPKQSPDVTVLNPQNRVPMSFIIDDSTCLVNMAYFGIPQFAEVFPDSYKQDWKKLPREIPDSFVRTFGQWCRDPGHHGSGAGIVNPSGKQQLQVVGPPRVGHVLQQDLAGRVPQNEARPGTHVPAAFLTLEDESPSVSEHVHSTCFLGFCQQILPYKSMGEAMAGK